MVTHSGNHPQTMARLPRRYAPFIFSVIQAALTTAAATAIAVHQSSRFSMQFLQQWFFAWVIAWLSMVPVVIFLAPLINRCVTALTAPPTE